MTLSDMKQMVLDCLTLLAYPQACYWVNKDSVNQLLQTLTDENLEAIVKENRPIPILVFAELQNTPMQIVVTFTPQDLLEVNAAVGSTLQKYPMFNLLKIIHPELMLDAIAQMVIFKHKVFDIDGKLLPKGDHNA